jgi:hypothetical protein
MARPNSACGLSSGRGCGVRGAHASNLHKKAGGVAAEEQEIPEVLLGFLYDHNAFPPHPLAQLDGLSARCQEEPEVDASRKRRYLVHLVDCESEALFAGEEPGAGPLSEAEVGAVEVLGRDHIPSADGQVIELHDLP